MSSNSRELHFMVDTETYGLRPDSVILSLGACTVLPPVETEFSNETFYEEFSVSFQSVRAKQQATMDWWATQSNCPCNGTTPLAEGLAKFIEWMSSLCNNRQAVPVVWCKGTDFDIPLLYNAFDQCGLKAPWKYNDVADLRTITRRLWPTTYTNLQRPEWLAQHNALHDAMWQAYVLEKLVNDLGVRNGE